MNTGFNNLLLNVLFIMVPLLLYQIFFYDNRRVNDEPPFKDIPFIVLWCISIILCLSYPISFSQGFIIDLRQVPFILGALYIGTKASVPLYLTMVIYRLTVGGDGAYINLAVATGMLVLTLFTRKVFLFLSSRMRIIFILITSFVSALLLVLLSRYFKESPFTISNNVVVGYLFVQLATTALITYMIEKMFTNYELRKQIHESEKIHLISQLSASVSHEIRNPLTVTTGFLQLLKENNYSVTEKNYFLDLSIAELKRAEKIINDFLSFAKPTKEFDTAKNIVVDVRYAIDILKPFASMNQVQINFTTDTEECYVLYHSHEFQQCLINLGKNSIEAMPGGGTIEFHITCSNEANVQVAINDTGIGMTAEEIKKLGTPYYSTKEKGTGLGMLVVFSIIRSIKGSLSIESEKGVGSTFTITIPKKKHS